LIVPVLVKLPPVIESVPLSAAALHGLDILLL